MHQGSSEWDFHLWWLNFARLWPSSDLPFSKSTTVMFSLVKVKKLSWFTNHIPTALTRHWLARSTCSLTVFTGGSTSGPHSKSYNYGSALMTTLCKLGSESFSFVICSSDGLCVEQVKPPAALNRKHGRKGWAPALLASITSDIQYLQCAKLHVALNTETPSTHQA